MTWSPRLEAHPEQYVRLVQETQEASSSGGGGKNLALCSLGQRCSAPTGEIEMLMLSKFDPERAEDQAGIGQAGTRLSAPAGHIDSEPEQPVPVGACKAGRKKKVDRNRCSHKGDGFALSLLWVENARASYTPRMPAVVHRGVCCLTTWPLTKLRLALPPARRHMLHTASGVPGTCGKAPQLQASCLNRPYSQSCRLETHDSRPPQHDVQADATGCSVVIPQGAGAGGFVNTTSGGWTSFRYQPMQVGKGDVPKHWQEIRQGKGVEGSVVTTPSFKTTVYALAACSAHSRQQATGAALGQSLANIGYLHPPSSRPGQAQQKGPMWHAALRTTVPGSACLAGICPAEDIADVHTAASQCLRKLAVLHELSSCMSDDGHHCSCGGARPGLSFGPASKAPGRNCPLQVQSKRSANGPCETLITTLPCSQDQQPSRIANHSSMHHTPAHLVHLTPILSTGCKLCKCTVKCGSNPEDMWHTSAPPAVHVLGTTLADATHSQALLQLVGIQVLRSANICAPMPGKGHKAGRMPAGLQTDPGHERFCSLRSCMGYLANTQIPWLPAHTDVIVSQKFKLSVVLRGRFGGRLGPYHNAIPFCQTQSVQAAP